MFFAAVDTSSTQKPSHLFSWFKGW